jgi:hypothetical protein
VYQIGLAILALLEKEICEMDVEEISSFMATSRLGAGSVHPFSHKERLQNDLLFTVTKFRVKNSDLEELANQFLSEKLMSVIQNELETNLSEVRSLDETPRMREVNSRSLGFSWLRSAVSDDPLFLRIDLAAFSTPNRPHEKLQTRVGFVNIPVPALRQIQRTLELIGQRSNKEMSAVTTLLSEVERRLMGETKQFNALVLTASRMDEVFKEVTVRKADMTERVQKAVTEGRTDLRTLLNEMAELEREYDAKKEQRAELFDIISEQEEKLAKIRVEKNNIIVRISAIAAQLEQTQNEVISRSILSAIDSFSNS